MADNSTVDRSQWAAVLDQVTKDHERESITIEIVDPTYGDNPEAERLPFNYANYDHKDDVVVIAVGGDSPQYPVVLRHIIAKPTEVDVADNAVRVVAADGTITLVSFFAADGS
jgi:hypothetical protein